MSIFFGFFEKKGFFHNFKSRLDVVFFSFLRRRGGMLYHIMTRRWVGGCIIECVLLISSPRPLCILSRKVWKSLLTATEESQMLASSWDPCASTQAWCRIRLEDNLVDTASYSRVLLDAALLHWSFLERRTTPNIQNVTTWTMEVQLCCQMNTNVL